jgi:hypothetical protein
MEEANGVKRTGGERNPPEISTDQDTHLQDDPILNEKSNSTSWYWSFPNQPVVPAPTEVSE